mgnify:CR=1 FL=1
MLVLSRKEGERVCIGEDVQVTVLEIRGNRVKLGFSGPASVPIHRGEVHARIGHWSLTEQCVECG